MSDDAIDRAAERIRMGRAARASETATPAASSSGAASRVTDYPRIGDRVFDMQRGRDGVVVTTPPGQVIVGPVVYVRYDEGDVCGRPIKRLLVRPTPPAPRS